MKRKHKVISILLLVAILFSLAACGDSSEKAPEEPPTNGDEGGDEVKEIGLSFGTASLGGNFFTMGAAMSAVIVDETGYKTVAQATGGSAYNVEAVHNKELDVAITQATAIAAAFAGTENFEGNAIDDIRTLLNYNATPIHIMVNKKLGAKDITDLKGAKIECLTPGDGIELTTKNLLPLLGLPIEDVKLEYSGNRVQAASRLKTGQVDAILDATGLGATWIADIYGNGDKFEFLSLTEEQINLIVDESPEFSKMIIPAETYDGQKEDSITVGNWTTLFVHEDMDEEVAYNITKAVFESKEDLIKAHSFFGDLEAENVAGATIAPLHPGAEKYYNEIGASVN